MKKTMKILTVLLLAIMLISLASNVFAAGSPLQPGDLANKIDYGDANATNELTSKAGQIMGLIRNISVIAAVIIIMVLGVKYMLGSVEEKADYKKSFMPLIIGIILVVAATSIASFIFGIVA